MKIIVIVFTLASTFPSISAAQINGWTVITSAQDTLGPCTIGALAGGFVYLSCDSSSMRLPVDSLKIILRQGEPHFWSSAGYGTLAGVAVGALFGFATYQRPSGSFTFDFGPGAAAFGGAILGGVAGFAIGGIVGASSGGEEKYDLSGATTEEKVKILHILRREYG